VAVSRVRGQASTRKATVRSIVASKEFARGFEEARLGKAFNPDNPDWQYERGRHFAFIAPLNMSLRIGKSLNSKAVRLAEAAFERRLLI
jgi:hypothetical protein